MDGPQDCNKRQKNCPTNGSYIGEHKINFGTSNPLHERFSGKPQNPSNPGFKLAIEEKIHENVAVHLGANNFEFDIIKAIKKSLYIYTKN